MKKEIKVKTEKQIENEKKNKTNLIFKLVCFSLIVILVGVSFIFKTKIESWLNYALNSAPIVSNVDKNGLVFNFINVGQADAILVEFPNDEVMLVDAGRDKEHKPETTAALKDYLTKSNLKTQGGEYVIDYFLVTHPHDDHMGAANAEFFATFKIESFYGANVPEGKASYDNLMQRVSAETSEINVFSAGLKLDIAGVTIDFYSPCADDLVGAVSDENEYSPVMIFSYGGKKVMLTGDTNEDNEENLLLNYASKLNELDVDVLKVGHHGSKTSSSKEFLDAVKPEYAVICVSNDNEYGHPTNEALTRIKKHVANENYIFRTDKNGNIKVGINNGEIAFELDSKPFSTINYQWWMLAVVVVGVSLILIFFLPETIKYIKKRGKKSLKKASKKQK